MASPKRRVKRQAALKSPLLRPMLTKSAGTESEWQNRIIGSGELNPKQIVQNAKNWRVHTKQQREALAGVMAQVGWVQRVIVNQQSGNLVDGHLRVDMALHRGEDKVPVEYVDLTAEEEALILATFDPITGMATADAEKLEALLKEISTGDKAVFDVLSDLAEMSSTESVRNILPRLKDYTEKNEQAEALATKWDIQTGQIWEIRSKTARGQRHRVICGDALDRATVRRLMNGKIATMTLTDPPYNVGYQYSEGSDTPDQMSKEEYRKFCMRFMQIAGECSQFQVVTSGKKNEDVFDYVDYMIWNKGFALTSGSWYRALVCEPILLFGEKPTGRFYPRDYFEVPTYKGPGVFKLHSCPKPVELFVQLIEPMTERGEIVYDPFLGSGTTLVACEQLGRVGHGVELSPAYVGVILERMVELGLEPSLVGDDGRQGSRAELAGTVV
jgi:hypothetical protein